jgi:hypothetical protein
VLLLLLFLVQVGSPDTLRIRSIDRSPRLDETMDSSHYGPPQLRMRTGQGTALVWLLRAGDSFFVAVAIPDSTPYWGDDFVLSMNVRGEGDPRPGHHDFQWYFRRVLDSSVVYRGRGGRWEAPRADPDWRLRAERAGGGWEVDARDDRTAWSLILRLDPAWLEGSEGRLPRVAVRIYDDAPQGWFAWPHPPGATPVSVEQSPAMWGVISLPHPEPFVPQGRLRERPSP